MIIGNVQIYTDEHCFKPGFVVTNKDRIEAIYIKDSLEYEGGQKRYGALSGRNCFDGKGAYLIPGMIDIHLHGCKGYDFCDGTQEAIEQIGAYQASIGVTTMALATMTLPVEQLVDILQQGVAYCVGKQSGRYEFCADLAGINMEGPFISVEKRGAQNAEYIKKPDIDLFRTFQKAGCGLIKYMGVAPEAEGVLDFVQQVKEEVTITVAHSNADYAAAKATFEAGAAHVTHLYNGMSEYCHREPGIVGAVYDCKDVEAELICDGLHVHPAVIRATFDMLGKERIIFISDSIRATGMVPGEYELGGQRVTVTEGRAVVRDTDTIAGSITTLPKALQYAVQVVGIPLEDALQCVTENPAKSLGIFEECGSITVGKKADMVLLNYELEPDTVIIAGKIWHG